MFPQVTRLLQLSVQQLLQSRDTLSSQLTNVTAREEELQERLASLDTEVRTVRKEAKKRKKMLAAQQECMFKGIELFFIVHNSLIQIYDYRDRL